jgi:hypothetical protein
VDIRMTKPRKIRWAGHIAQKLEAGGLLESPRHSWEDNLKMDFK